MMIVTNGFIWACYQEPKILGIWTKLETTSQLKHGVYRGCADPAAYLDQTLISYQWISFRCKHRRLLTCYEARQQIKPMNRTDYHSATIAMNFWLSAWERKNTGLKIVRACRRSQEGWSCQRSRTSGSRPPYPTCSEAWFHWSSDRLMLSMEDKPSFRA
mgnify:CR=1 FL=1